MSVERPATGASRERDEDSPRANALARVVLWVVVAAVLAGALVVAGSAYLRHRAYLRDAHGVGELNHKVAVLNQPLSDDEFQTALAFCEAPDTETRFTALVVATADAIRRNPDRKARVQPVAVRLLDDPVPVVREKAIKALAGLRARDQVERIRPMLQAADPRERKAAEEAVATLEAGEAPK